jgi:hypothetical protein
MRSCAFNVDFLLVLLVLIIVDVEYTFDGVCIARRTNGLAGPEDQEN